jgi:transcriptional regulator with XRE-family HTH domain
VADGVVPIPNLTVAEYISRQIETSGKTQAQIALETGYDRPNLISMIKHGHTKLPVQKVGALARALGVDPAFLLRLVMMEYAPATWNAINEIQGAIPVTQNERIILNEIRRLSQNADPKLHSLAQQRALKAFVTAMIG